MYTYFDDNYLLLGLRDYPAQHFSKHRGRDFSVITFNIPLGYVPIGYVFILLITTN